MKKYLIMIVGVVFLSATWAGAGGDPQKQVKTPQTTPAASKPTVIEENLKTLTATVEAIDLANQKVTLKGPKGKLLEVKVGDTVKNLPQVSVGDLVVVRYYESIAAQLVKPGTPLGSSMQEAVGTAKPGQMPAGVAGRQVTVTAKIEAIDKKAQKVTLKGPEGKTAEVKVPKPKMLEKVKVGDEVLITYTEALAIVVEKAVKK